MSDRNDIGRWMQDAMRLADAPCPHCGAVASEDTGPWPSCNHNKPTATFLPIVRGDSTLEEMGLSNLAVEARSRYAAAAARDAPMRSLFRDTIAGLREIATADPDDTMSLACQALVTVCSVDSTPGGCLLATRRLGSAGRRCLRSSFARVRRRRGNASRHTGSASTSPRESSGSAVAPKNSSWMETDC
jgi:hypothetical protein